LDGEGRPIRPSTGNLDILPLRSPVGAAPTLSLPRPDTATSVLATPRDPAPLQSRAYDALNTCLHIAFIFARLTVMYHTKQLNMDSNSNNNVTTDKNTSNDGAASTSAITSTNDEGKLWDSALGQGRSEFKLVESGVLPLVLSFLSSSSPLVRCLAVVTLSTPSESGLAHLFLIKADAHNIVHELGQSNDEWIKENIALSMSMITRHSANVDFIVQQNLPFRPLLASMARSNNGNTRRWSLLSWYRLTQSTMYATPSLSVSSSNGRALAYAPQSDGDHNRMDRTSMAMLVEHLAIGRIRPSTLTTISSAAPVAPTASASATPAPLSNASLTSSNNTPSLASSHPLRNRVLAMSILCNLSSQTTHHATIVQAQLVVPALLYLLSSNPLPLPSTNAVAAAHANEANAVAPSNNLTRSNVPGYGRTGSMAPTLTITNGGTVLGDDGIALLPTNPFTRSQAQPYTHSKRLALQIIVNLSQTPSCHATLLRHGVLPILLTILNNSPASYYPASLHAHLHTVPRATVASSLTNSKGGATSGSDTVTNDGSLAAAGLLDNHEVEYVDHDVDPDPSPDLRALQRMAATALVNICGAPSAGIDLRRAFNEHNNNKQPFRPTPLRSVAETSTSGTSVDEEISEVEAERRKSLTDWAVEALCEGAAKVDGLHSRY
jgi:hypothetical protein